MNGERFSCLAELSADSSRSYQGKSADGPNFVHAKEIDV